jgi:hypothetical protein
MNCTKNGVSGKDTGRRPRPGHFTQNPTLPAVRSPIDPELHADAQEYLGGSGGLCIVTPLAATTANSAQTVFRR